MDNHRRIWPFGTANRALMCLAFFISGAAALIYEVSWSRQFGLLVGHTVQAANVVLTSYFAGLAIGYALGGWIIQRVRPPLAYAAAEFTAAAWACLVPLLLSWASPWLGGPGGTSGSYADELVRWMFCTLFLLPATSALGMTLPLIAEWLAPAGRPQMPWVALFYAVNTAGALVGVIATITYLMVNTGVQSSGVFAAGLSILSGTVALIVDRYDARPAIPRPPGPQIEASHKNVMWPYVAAGISGFGILALEVLYIRLFSLVLHNSTYTFGLILAVVLLGIAISPLLARVLVRIAGARSVVTWAAWVGAVAIVISIVVFASITRFEYFRSGSTFASYLAGAFGLVALVVLPPVIALGLILPALWCGHSTQRESGGQIVARFTIVNAIASAIGATSASFLLLPNCDLWISFVLVATAFLLLAVVGLVRERRPRSAIFCAMTFSLAAIPIVWPPGPERWSAVDAELVQRWATPYGWIDVAKDRDGAMKVRQNLHYWFGTTGSDAPRAYRQAHIPLLLHPRPADVLFLGLGTGLTAAGAVLHPEVERAQVIELIPEVIKAAKLLGRANRDVVGHPKVQITVGDARHFLRATNDRFDVIVSDLYVPWESQTGYLYTVEHFQATRLRLKPRGLFCQWLPLYQLSARELELIADSFNSVFKDTSLWWGNIDARRPIVALVGSDTTTYSSAAEIDRRLRTLWQRVEVDDQLRSSKELVGMCLGHWQARRPDHLNTDEFPRVEFLTPLSHQNQTLLRNATLRSYYDDVLSRLSDRYETFLGDAKEGESRRAWQRLTLFP